MTTEHHGPITLHHGDCLDVLRGLPDASVDAVVTDPPYGLEFMGKGWDSFAPESPKLRSGWAEAGSTHGIADEDAGGKSRVTFHKRRSTYRCDGCGKRDGFRNAHGSCAESWQHEWVDDRPLEALSFGAWCELWSRECLRVLKPGGHLLAFGGTRTWHRLACAVEDAGFEVRDSIAWLYGSGFPKSLDVAKAIDKAAGAERKTYKRAAFGGTFSDDNGTTYGTAIDGTPITDDARTWQGWGTALKPAFEPVVVARKPLAGTVAANVLAHGTGALNIDGCRIGDGDGVVTFDRADRPGNEVYNLGTVTGVKPSGRGRWPANVVLDDHQAAELDQQSGESTSKRSPRGEGKGETGTYGAWGMAEDDTRGHDDVGGASRFFYVAKADQSERVRLDGTAHPTVKPLELMRWLVRLVTPPGGTVLEPFAGSGTTAEACLLEGLKCIAIEREADYLPLIRQRINRRRDPVAATAAARSTDDDPDLFQLLEAAP